MLHPVTTWIDVINYVRTRYEVLEETGDWLRLRLDTAEGRNHQAAVHHLADEGKIEISSPVGWADKIDQDRLSELAKSAPIGETGVVDNVALLKHTLPLPTDSIQKEFEQPLTQLVRTADEFELELTKADHF
jgi:hypothetical protein